MQRVAFSWELAVFDGGFSHDYRAIRERLDHTEQDLGLGFGFGLERARGWG